MKIFLDTSNLDQIREVAGWGVLDGVTTNPTNMSREGVDFHTRIRDICQVVDGPVSAEVISTDADGMVREGQDLVKIHPNVYVKVPMGEEGLKATHRLSQDGVRVNMTLIFQPNQALLAAKAGAAFVSPFIGRHVDIGYDGVNLIREIAHVFSNYDFDTEILAASARDPVHVLEVAKAGAHIATLPYAVIKKMVRHPLTDLGLQQFLDDWAKVQKPLKAAP